jgi:hypothetical protein
MAGTIVTVISSPGLRAFGPSLSPSLEMAWTLPPRNVHYTTLPSVPLASIFIVEW